MDYVTRQFINLTKKFRKDLRILLTKLDRTLDKQAEAVRENAKTANRKQTPPELTAVVYLPESIEVHQKTEDARGERNYRLVTVFVTSLTLGAIVVYSVLVYRQYQEMIKSTGVSQQVVVEARLNREQADKSFKSTIEQFHLDQRAWVAVVEIDGIPELNNKWTITVRARNTGKTFAKALHGTATAEPVLKGEKPDFAKDVMTGNQFLTVGVLAPNSDWTTVMGDPNGGKINQTALDDIAQGNFTEFVHGHLSYEDVFGCHHWVDYCFRLGTDLRWAGCNEHNSIDENACQKQ